MTKRQPCLMIFVLFSVTLLLSLALFFYGEAGFLGDETILWQLRFPKIVTAYLAGGMLASAGLLLQIFFQNPLAGPDLLGINAGASLGVALAIMGAPLLPAGWGELGQPLMAFLGALAIFFMLTFLLRKNLSPLSFLIMGLLIASFASSFISILANMSPSLQVKNFLMWSLGSFQNLTLATLPWFIGFSLVALSILFFLPKRLNQFTMGENYARSMGVNVASFKIVLILLCSLLVAVTTTFCGPIGFIGIIAPHMARKFIKRSDLRLIMPGTFFVGSGLALFAELILVFTSEYSLATNSILGLIGAPLIALYLYRERRVM